MRQTLRGQARQCAWKILKMNQGIDTVGGVHFQIGAQCIRDLAETKCAIKILPTEGT